MILQTVATKTTKTKVKQVNKVKLVRVYILKNNLALKKRCSAV